MAGKGREGLGRIYREGEGREGCGRVVPVVTCNVWGTPVTMTVALLQSVLAHTQGGCWMQRCHMHIHVWEPASVLTARCMWHHTLVHAPTVRILLHYTLAFPYYYITIYHITSHHITLWCTAHRRDTCSHTHMYATRTRTVTHTLSLTTAQLTCSERQSQVRWSPRAAVSSAGG